MTRAGCPYANRGVRLIILLPKKADRPFLFFVRVADYGNILYAGRVADPTK